MKKIHFTLLTVGAILLSSCKTEIPNTTYKADTAESSLNWTGKYVSDGHTHTGTISIEKGSLVYQEDEFISGEFIIDMNTIVDTDLDGEKKSVLESHLKGEKFFNVSQYAKTKVIVSSIADGKAKLMIQLMGKEIQTEVPVTIHKKENQLQLKGKFDIDFSKAELPGFKAQDGDPDDAHVDSILSFEINLILNK